MRYLFFAFCFLTATMLWAQETESDTIQNILVKPKTVENVEDSQNNGRKPGPPPTDPYRDFIRNKVILRIPLQQKENQLLLDARPQSNFVQSRPMHDQITEGLVPNLLAGLRSGAVLAYHPEKIRDTLKYWDLIHHMLKIQGYTTSDLEGKIAADDLDWHKLETCVDLIVDEAFNIDKSDFVMRIHYIRLVRFDPQMQDRRIQYVALFRWQDVRDYLQEIGVETQQYPPMFYNVRAFLETRRFEALILPLNGGSPNNLPPHLRRKQKMREEWPELWEKNR